MNDGAFSPGIVAGTGENTAMSDYELAIALQYGDASVYSHGHNMTFASQEDEVEGTQLLFEIARQLSKEVINSVTCESGRFDHTARDDCESASLVHY